RGRCPCCPLHLPHPPASSPQNVPTGPAPPFKEHINDPHISAQSRCRRHRDRRAACRARRTGGGVLRLLCRQGRCQAVQQIVEGRAHPRRPDHRHHHGQRLRGRA